MVMALTGLALSLFLFTHVAGNLLVLVDTAKFNEYAWALENLGPLLWAAEIGLIALVVGHLVMAVQVTRRNRSARPEVYYKRESSGRSRRSLGSSTMALSGVLILVFIVYHITHFKYGETAMLEHQGKPMRDLAGLVVAEFSDISEVLIYTVALVAIGLHLRHGFRSLFDTLGVASARFERCFKGFSEIYVITVVAGFIAIPWAIYLGVGR